jgi:hypothetical protein
MEAEVNLRVIWLNPDTGKFLPKLPDEFPYPIEEVVATTANVPSCVNNGPEFFTSPENINVKFPELKLNPGNVCPVLNVEPEACKIPFTKLGIEPVKLPVIEE